MRAKRRVMTYAEALELTGPAIGAPTLLLGPEARDWAACKRTPVPPRLQRMIGRRVAVGEEVALSMRACAFYLRKLRREHDQPLAPAEPQRSYIESRLLEAIADLRGPTQMTIVEFNNPGSFDDPEWVGRLEHAFRVMVAEKKLQDLVGWLRVPSAKAERPHSTLTVRIAAVCALRLMKRLADFMTAKKARDLSVATTWWATRLKAPALRTAESFDPVRIQKVGDARRIWGQLVRKEITKIANTVVIKPAGRDPRDDSDELKSLFSEQSLTDFLGL